jgi:hypothetical protein
MIGPLIFDKRPLQKRGLSPSRALKAWYFMRV